jgi:mannosylglycerate hydrolase
VRNAAHDSICACSHDEVVKAVLHRFAESRQIGDEIAARALATLGASFAQPGPVVVNTSGRPRSGVVEVVLTGSGDVEGGQPVGTNAGLDMELVLSPSEIKAIVEQLDGDQVSQDAFVNDVEVDEVEDGAVALEVTVHVGPVRRNDLPLDELKRGLLARLALKPDDRVRVRLAHSASRRLLVRADEVPGFGWKRYEPGPLSHPVSVETGSDGAVRLTNGLVTVDIDPADGTFAVDGTAGFNRLVDCGDHGDTYNYSPPEHDVIVDTPLRSEISVREHGPVRASVDVVRTYSFPEHIDDSARSRVGEREVVVHGTVELRAGEKLVRVSSSFENPCRDHRLRAHFPLPTPAESSKAECAFALVERGLHAEGGPSERAMPTYPSRRFVHAGGLSVFHDGLLEYELVDIETADDKGGERAHALALTLLRATGMLSRLTMLNRPLPAGPANPLHTSQMLGPLETRYAIAVGEQTNEELYALADDAFLPLAVVPTLGGGDRAAQGSYLSVSGAEVSAVRRASGGSLEVRVFNPCDTTVTVDVEIGGKPASGHLVDLRGRQVAPLLGTLTLEPWRIATVQISGA